jgi:hypothetical protein
MVWTTQDAAAASSRRFASAATRRDLRLRRDLARPRCSSASRAARRHPFPINFASEISTSPEAQAFSKAYEAKFKKGPDTYARRATGHLSDRPGREELDGRPTREALAEAIGRSMRSRAQRLGGLPMVNAPG